MVNSTGEVLPWGLPPLGIKTFELSYCPAGPERGPEHSLRPGPLPQQLGRRVPRQRAQHRREGHRRLVPQPSDETQADPRSWR